MRTLAFMTLVAIAGAGSAGAKGPKGYWCFSTTHGSDSISTCTRKEDDCALASSALASLSGNRTTSCAWQESVWKTRIDKEVRLFAVQSECEEQAEFLGGSRCKAVK